MRWNISIVFSWISITVSALTYWFSQTFLSELIISFSPYIILWCLALLLINIFALRNAKKQKKTLHAFTVLLLGFTIFLYGNMITNFYQGEIKPIQNTPHHQNTGINIMFSNIYYQNTHTDEILEKIQQEKPDIIAFVEFSIYHKEKLYNQITEIYPYTNINQRSANHAGNIIFSKYPITNLIEKTQQWSRRYNYISITYNGQEYYIYLVHTSAPITLWHFQNRNKQIKKLTEDIQTHTHQRPSNAKVIIMGDFNITPRSYYYKKTLDKITLHNITKNKKILFTRKNSRFTFLHAHIDHIFLSNNISIKNLKSFQLLGSDHKGVFIQGLE